MQINFLSSSRNSFSFQIGPEKIFQFFRGPFPILCAVFLFSLLIGHSTALGASSELKKQFEEGVALFQQGKDKEAETRFLEILREDPTLVLPHQYLGMVYSRSNRWEEAKAAFRAVIQKAPTFPGGHFGLGLVLENQGEIKQAEEHFRKTITLAPAHISAWLHLGRLLEGQRKMEEAVGAYQKVIEQSLAASPEADEAEQHLRELGDTPEIARQVQAWVAEAEARLKEGKRNEAWALYQKAAGLLPKSLLIRLFMGSLASQLGNAAKAEEVFREATQIDPTALQPRLSLAKFYEQIGKTDEAIKEYETLLLLNHDETLPEIRSAKEAFFILLDRKEIQELTQRGEVLTKEGKWGEALQYFQAAAAIDPGVPVVHHNLARFYDQTNRPDLVLQSVHEALLLEPNSRVLHLLRGKALREQRAFQDSLAAYIKTLSLSPKDQQGLFYLEAQAGLLQTEFEMLKALIEAGGPFSEGLQKKKEGELNEAQASLEQAARLLPESPLIHQALGEVYEKKGEREKAIAAFEKGVELKPGLYPAWRALSRLYAQQGRYAKALDALERLLRLPDQDLTPLAASREEIEKEREAAQQKLEEARGKTRALFNQGQEALSKGEKEKAISLFESANNEEKDNLSILYSLGIAYAIEEKWPEATETFSKILDSDPLHPGALLRLGAVQEARGMLPTAAQTYRRLLLQKERSDAPEHKEAAARLAAVTETLKRFREAERHEKRGIAVLNKLSEIASKSGTAQSSADERPDPAQVQLALWDLKQAVALRPQEARYYYNLGLLYEHVNFGPKGMDRENAERVKKEPSLLEEPVSAYRAAIEIDPRYLPPYARLGQLYERLEENDKALTFYKSLLAEAPEPRPMEVKEIEARVQTLERRFFGNVGYAAGLDSNFSLSEPPQDETFNSLSANLVYYLVRSPHFQMPFSYQQDTSFYYRTAIYFSSHSLSLGFQHRPNPSLSYGMTGRFQASFAKNGGVGLLLSQGTASISRFGTIPTILVLEYGFSDFYFRHNARLDAQEHRGTLSATQAFGWQDEADLSYTFNDRQSPGSPDNSYQGHRLQLGYRRWVRPDLQFRGSATVLSQDFLHPDSQDPEGRIRQNTLLSYSVGLLYVWSGTTNLFIDYRWQENRSNLGPAFLSQEDILQGRSTALGDYEKRTVTVGVNVAF